MRFSTVAFFGLASTAFAAPVEIDERQFGGITLPVTDTRIVDNAFAVIKAATVDLDNTIKGINSDDLLKLLALDDKANALVDTVNQQTAKVNGSPNIGVISALGVAAKAQDLINTIKTTLNDLKSKKKFTTAASVNDLVVGDLQKLKAAAEAFVNALGKKAPSIAQFLVDLDRKQIVTAFDDAIKFFQAK